MRIAYQAEPRSKPAALELHAADNLQFIRDTMERAAAFTAVPGQGGIVIGLTAFATGWFAHSYPLRMQFWMWLFEGFIAAALGMASLYRKSKRISVPLSSRTAKRALLSFVTPMAAGAILTVALYPHGAISLFAGVWLLLYGVAVVSAGAFSVRAVPTMGLCFVALGSLALLTPSSLSNVWLMAGFGGLHVVFGFTIARNYGG